MSCVSCLVDCARLKSTHLANMRKNIRRLKGRPGCSADVPHGKTSKNKIRSILSTAACNGCKIVKQPRLTPNRRGWKRAPSMRRESHTRSMNGYAQPSSKGTLRPNSDPRKFDTSKTLGHHLHKEISGPTHRARSSNTLQSAAVGRTVLLITFANPCSATNSQNASRARYTVHATTPRQG